MPEVHISTSARIRARRGVSGLGVILVVIGIVVLAVSFSVLPRTIYELWPVIVIGVGVAGLLRPAGRIQELDFTVPGVPEALQRPRRAFSWFLVGAGLVLLLLTTHAVDQRVIGPVILIALGAFLLWRRWR